MAKKQSLGLVSVVVLAIFTVMAGCQSRTSTVAMSKDCSSQTAPARHRLMFAAAWGSRDQISIARPMTHAAMSNASTQPGHAPSRTNSPLENTGIGYLKKNENMYETGVPAVCQPQCVMP